MYLHTDGTISELDPVTTYDSNGDIAIPGWSDIAHVWWGGHEPEEVTAAQAQLLVNAGYTVIGYVPQTFLVISPGGDNLLVSPAGDDLLA